MSKSNSTSTTQGSVFFLLNSLEHGGAQRVFVDDANHLANNGWQVYLITMYMGGPLVKELSPLISFHDLQAKHLLDFSAIRQLRRLVSSVQGAILISTLNEANIIGRIAALSMFSLTLYTREANMADRKPILYKFMDILLGWRSTKILTVSAAVRNSLLSYSPWLKSKVVVFTNGVEIPEQAVKLTDRNNVRLLTVGNLRPNKDHQILIKAVGLLPQRFRLSIIGGGSLEAVLRQQAGEAGLLDRIEFMGALSRAEIVTQYQEHDLFVLPSKYEGCPNAMLEAMAAGIPAVAFSIPGLLEVVSNAGVLVPTRSPLALANAIESAAHKRQVLGRRARLHATDNFSRQKHIKNLLNLLGKQGRVTL